MHYVGNVIRPPSEANSIILQVTTGCSHNKCTFCGAYKDQPFTIKDLSVVKEDLQFAKDHCRKQKRLFLADGDVLILSQKRLITLLSEVRLTLPWVNKVSLYGSAKAVRSKTLSQLQELKSLGLDRVYMGLESGDEQTLGTVRKGESASKMIEAASMAQSQNLHMSVMVLLGLAGSDRSSAHAANTAKALNQMQPRLLSFLRVVPIPGSEFHEQIESGELKQLSERGNVEELRTIIAGLELNRTVLRANHSSNIVPLEARLPRDKERILAELDAIISSGSLDSNRPGPMPFSL